MTTAQELKERFHQCMPLFIALGDEMRLSIIELIKPKPRSSIRMPAPSLFKYKPSN